MKHHYLVVEIYFNGKSRLFPITNISVKVVIYHSSKSYVYVCDLDHRYETSQSFDRDNV